MITSRRAKRSVGTEGALLGSAASASRVAALAVRQAQTRPRSGCFLPAKMDAFPVQGAVVNSQPTALLSISTFVRICRIWRRPAQSPRSSPAAPRLARTLALPHACAPLGPPPTRRRNICANQSQEAVRTQWRRFARGSRAPLWGHRECRRRDRGPPVPMAPRHALAPPASGRLSRSRRHTLRTPRTRAHVPHRHRASQPLPRR